MQIDLHALFQECMMYVALGGLAVFLVILLLEKLGPILHRLYHDFLHLDGFGRFVVVGGIALATLYGGSKGFWGQVQSGGGDTAYAVTGIFTATSNDVQVVDSITTTNVLHLVKVEWTGTGADTNTPVSVRTSETNEWVEIEKFDPVLTAGVTNSLVFHTSTNNYSSVPFWWFGSDRPAIVVTEEGIEIRSFVVTTRTVTFTFVCGEQEATTFVIRRREVGKQNWEAVGSVPAQYGKVMSWTGQMFTVDKTYDWQITTTIGED